MTGYKSKKAAAQDKLKCQCSMTTSLVGSGCQYCNPEYMDDETQPAQEPVAWYHAEDFKTHFTTGPSEDLVKSGYWQPLYTTPPQEQQSCDKRLWVGLTDDEYNQIWRQDLNNKDLMDLTIAKLKDKNT